MPRRIPQVLAFGLGLIAGGVGLLFLIGLWISTSREIALWEALGEGNFSRWRFYDGLYVGWVYGFLGGLLLLTVGVGFYWLGKISGGIGSVEMALRNLLEGRPLSGLGSEKHPQEISALHTGLEELARFHRRLEALLRGEVSPSPQDEALSPHLQEILRALQGRFLQAASQERFYQAWKNGALKLLDWAYSLPDEKAYLQRAVSWLTEQAGGFIGGFYRLRGRQLVREAGFAYPAGAPDTFQVGEGWVGTIAQTGEALWLYPVSGQPLMGEENLAMAFLPVIAGNQLLGVWEMVAFSPWPDEDKQLVEGWLTFLAIGILSFQQKAQEEALQKSLKNAQELQSQLESQVANMTQSLQIIQREKEDLEKLMQQREQQLIRLETQLHEHKTREKFILEHLQEVVVFFEASGRARAISPSIENLLGYKPDELEAFFRYIAKEDAENVATFFRNIQKNPDEALSVTFRYRHKTGETVWLELRACNRLQDPTIGAIVGFIRDITVRVEFERQYRTRLKFQSLVEHSPDLIWRLDKEGNFLYVNPVIEEYTGYPPTHYIRNSVYSVGFSIDEVRFWRRFLDSIFNSLEMKTEEIRFPSVYGERRMSVRGIPELGPDGAVETVVVLLQDITELREAQERLRRQKEEVEQLNMLLRKQKRELEERNRDIMESITYARRIQEGILVGEEIVRRYFADGFVLHKLRDVVGGDFYWVREVDGRVYVAVVDCTGHGVPGAFMALLGNTLLEGAIQDRRLWEPARILQDMEYRLREMLGAGETPDGMDVALCVFEPERRVLHFCWGAPATLVLSWGAMAAYFRLACRLGWRRLARTPQGLHHAYLYV
jgi:PAS domain S-box-containing protein